MQTHICTTDAQIHLKNMQTKKCTYVHMDTYMQTHMDVHVHTQKHPHCNTCSHTHMFYTNKVHTNRQTSLSLSTHTHAHTHTHTQNTHTHTQPWASVSLA